MLKTTPKRVTNTAQFALRETPDETDPLVFKTMNEDEDLWVDGYNEAVG